MKPRSLVLPCAGLLLAAGLLFHRSQRETPIGPASAPAKLSARATHGDRPASFRRALESDRGSSTDQLRAWAARLDPETLFTILDEGMRELAELDDGAEARRARSLLTALAMEAGQRDIERALKRFHLDYGPSLILRHGTASRDLLAVMMAGHAVNDPADAWLRLCRFHDQANYGACGTMADPKITGQNLFFPSADEAAIEGETIPRTPVPSPNPLAETWVMGLSSLAESPTTRAATEEVFTEWTRRDPKAALAAIAEFPRIGAAGSARFADAIRAFANSCAPEWLDPLSEELKRHLRNPMREEPVPGPTDPVLSESELRELIRAQIDSFAFPEVAVERLRSRTQP